MRRGKSRSRDRPLACAQGGRKSAENCGQRGKKGGGGKITSFRFAGRGRRRGELVTAVTLGRGNYVGVKKERWNLHSVAIKKGTEKNKVKPTHILYKIYICWRASSLAKMQFLWFFLKRNPAAKQVHLGKHCWVRCPCLSPLWQASEIPPQFQATPTLNCGEPHNSGNSRLSPKMWQNGADVNLANRNYWSIWRRHPQSIWRIYLLRQSMWRIYPILNWKGF